VLVFRYEGTNVKILSDASRFNNSKKKSHTQLSSLRSYTKLKEVDDVLGGSAAWENVDSTEEACPKCSHPRAYFMQIQVRYRVPVLVPAPNQM
jgi:DNA-directed RNA polymerase subunit M/transcription elongation factor TFIIS